VTFHPRRSISSDDEVPRKNHVIPSARPREARLQRFGVVVDDPASGTKIVEPLAEVIDDTEGAFRNLSLGDGKLDERLAALQLVRARRPRLPDVDEPAKEISR
jgi:hypothetical protein